MSQRDGRDHSDDSDATRLAELGHRLTAIDVDADRAARIAWAARQDVGRRPSPWRLIEPTIAAALTVSYMIWALLRVFEVLNR